MSKVKYTVDVDEYICSALEQIRTMDKTRDYSSLMAVVERIQHHANAMETSITASFSTKKAVIRTCEKEGMDDADFRKEVMDLMKYHLEKADRDSKEYGW